MTIVQITLPDQLAEEAANAGLLRAERIEALLREQLRLERLAQLRDVRHALAADPVPAMTAAEIDSEITAYRDAQRRAAGA
jgi:pyridoxal biosynthesis lyase PdxS